MGKHSVENKRRKRCHQKRKRCQTEKSQNNSPVGPFPAPAINKSPVSSIDPATVPPIDNKSPVPPIDPSSVPPVNSSSVPPIDPSPDDPSFVPPGPSIDPTTVFSIDKSPVPPIHKSPDDPSFIPPVPPIDKSPVNPSFVPPVDSPPVSPVNSYPASSVDLFSSTSSVSLSLQTVGPSHVLSAEPVPPVDVAPSPPESSTSNDAFWEAFDRMVDEQAKYWESVDPDIRDLNEYRDIYPTIVTDKEKYIEVCVIDSHQEIQGLKRVSIEEHFARLHRREAMAVSLCKQFRDRIEALEDKLYESQTKLVKLHKDKEDSIARVRGFWRNKVLEEGSRSGMILLAGLKQYNCYSKK